MISNLEFYTKPIRFKDRIKLFQTCKFSNSFYCQGHFDRKLLQDVFHQNKGVNHKKTEKGSRKQGPNIGERRRYSQTMVKKKRVQDSNCAVGLKNNQTNSRRTEDERTLQEKREPGRLSMFLYMEFQRSLRVNY